MGAWRHKKYIKQQQVRFLFDHFKIPSEPSLYTSSTVLSVTYICRGHCIQFLLIARIATLSRSQVQRRGPMNSPAAARMDPRLPPQRPSKLVLLLFEPLPRLLVPLLLAGLVLEMMRNAFDQPTISVHRGNEIVIKTPSHQPSHFITLLLTSILCYVRLRVKHKFNNNSLTTRIRLIPPPNTHSLSRLTFFLISSNSVARFSFAEVIGLEDIRFRM